MGVHVGTVVDTRELGLGAARGAAGRRPRGKTEVVEDGAGDDGVLDRGDEGHPVAAARAEQRVDAEGAPEQGRPVEAAVPVGIVGAGEVVRRERMDRNRAVWPALSVSVDSERESNKVMLQR